MEYLEILLVAIFLPLFPFSMLFNALYVRTQNSLLRSVLLLSWPQIGLLLIHSFGMTISHGLLAWALLTSILYAFRTVALREFGLWTSFIGTSSWALLWIAYGNGADAFQLTLLSAGISIPLVLMALLGAGLKQRFGAAYLGLYGGLAQTIPRFTGVLVVVVLAIVATPLFPTFFVMLSLIIKAIPTAPLIAVGVAIVWLLWSWAAARLLQGLIVGPQHNSVADLNQATLWLYIAVLVGLIISGIHWLGVMS